MSFFFQLPSLFLILSVVNNRVKKYENGKKKEATYLNRYWRW